jgi:hypothetical protein
MRSEPVDTGAGQLLTTRHKRQLSRLHPVKQPPNASNDLGNGLPERLGVVGADIDRCHASLFNRHGEHSPSWPRGPLPPPSGQSSTRAGRPRSAEPNKSSPSDPRFDQAYLKANTTRGALLSRQQDGGRRSTSHPSPRRLARTQRRRTSVSPLDRAHAATSFPHGGECPINGVTVCDG